MIEKAQNPGIDESIYKRPPEETEKVIQAARERAAGEIAILEFSRFYVKLKPWESAPDDLYFMAYRRFVFFTMDDGELLFAVDVIDYSSSRGYEPPPWALIAVMPLWGKLLAGGTLKLNTRRYRRRLDFNTRAYDYFVLHNYFPEYSDKKVASIIQSKYGITKKAWPAFVEQCRKLESGFKQTDGAEYYATPERHKQFLSRFPAGLLSE